MSLNLIDLNIGEKGIIKKIVCSRPIQERLHTMGLIRGVLIEASGLGPFISPRIYRYLNTQVAIRNGIAGKIKIIKQ